VADGLTLYKEHVRGLHDADATIVFTRKMNGIFDLLNGRHPSEAVQMNRQHDKLKVTACSSYVDLVDDSYLLWCL